MVKLDYGVDLRQLMLADKGELEFGQFSKFGSSYVGCRVQLNQHQKLRHAVSMGGQDFYA